MQPPWHFAGLLVYYKQLMKQYIQTAKTYVASHKKQFIIGLAVTVGVAAAIVGIVLLVRHNTVKIVYQPANACTLFSSAEASETLGRNTIRSGAQAPILSGNTAASNCGYTDGNPEENSMVVAAIIVRSGVNDKGVQQNKTEFAAGKPSKNVETVKNLGDSAYFNKENGQLNVLAGHEWIVLSYGVGSSPSTNSESQSVDLMKKILAS